MIYFSYAITLKTENYFLHKEHPYHNHWQLPGFGCLHTLHLHNLLDQSPVISGTADSRTKTIVKIVIFIFACCEKHAYVELVTFQS